MPRGRWRLGLLTGGALIGLLGVLASALPRPARSEPYTPRSGAEVLERLPERFGARRPAPPERDPARAERSARQQLELYGRTSDPRFLGRAEAQLAAFWQEPEPPPGIAVLRAKIRAAGHDFGAALRDLDLVLRREPSQVQARFERAAISVVLARYDAALDDCAQLRPLVPPLMASGCQALVGGMTGGARPAAALLRRELASPRASAEERAWAESLLGELLARVGESGQAELAFRRALALDDRDVYARGALADLLLDEQRYTDVVALLAPFEEYDGLLLRLAIAEDHLGDARAYVERLAARFAAARERGSALHQREEARFELALRDDPDRALQLALANFEVQRESWDIRLVLETALAARRPAAARPAAEHVRRIGLEDVRVAGLARAVERGAGR